MPRTTPPQAKDSTPGVNNSGVASSGWPNPIVPNSTSGCAYVA